jgi:HEAT repeat protein
MRLPRPAAIIAALLTIAVSTPPALFSQTAPKPSQPKQPAPTRRQPKRQQRADALAPAVNKLLKLDPRAPESPDEKDSGSADASSGEETKPPADGAPIKELTAFWSQGHGANAPKPSDKVRQRLLEACEDRPELTPGLIGVLPETTDTHDRLYKLLKEDVEDSVYLQDFLRRWLRHNSRYFRDDLIADARGESVNEASPDESLRSLARLDWEAARPIVEALASAGKAQMTPVALSLLYERAQAAGDSARIEKYRALLKAIVADRRSPADARRTALLSLVSADWNGQEDWVVSLFADSALGGLKENSGASDGGSKASSEKPEKAEGEENIDVAPDILSSLLDKYPQRWFPVISDLVGHNQRTVHRAAVKLLAGYLYRESADEKLKEEIKQKLAPWLTDPNWADADDRSGFIQSLAGVQAPELLSGLLWVLEYDEDQGNRATAAEALTQYRDPRAIPALRHALDKEEDEGRREKIVAALAECGGFSDDEVAEAIEAYSKVAVTEEGEQEIDRIMTGDSDNVLPLKVSIGHILSERKKFHAAEGLVLMLIERANSLRASQPAVARQILRSVEGVPLRVAEINLVERIGDGWADVAALTLALENRDSIQKSAGDELYSLIKQGGYAAGIAAAVLNDEREHRETLKGPDQKAQLALLAGARYLRDKLPVELASRLLGSPNRALARAVESYMEAEDSAEARSLVLARRRGEAYILGDGDAGYEPFLENLRKWEEAMRKEIKGAVGLEAIYALARSGSDENFNGVIIRVRDGKAEISLYEVEGRRDVRSLTESEFEELKSFTSRQEVEDLGPETYDADPGRMKYEYLRLSKDGGRRIVLDGLHGLRRTPKNPTLHEELSGLFYRLSRSGEFVTRYALEDKISGVEVLMADKKQQAMMVCGEGREIRVLIWEKGAEYKRSFAEAMPEWREFSSGAPGKVTDEPSASRLLSAIPMLMEIRRNGRSGGFSEPIWVGGAWLATSSGEDAGVWKFEPGAEPAKIISGRYANPIVTPDGKWLVAIKTLKEGGEYSSQLVRHNLQTGKEFPVTMPNGDFRPPATYVMAHAKVLLGNAGHHPGEINYLLDPETGTVQQIKGEFRPLMEDSPRELQPTGNPNEFWATIHDSQKGATNIGRYDSRNFVFKPLVELTGLPLSNSNFWVDATAGKIWFTYKGQLLRLPMPAQMK